MNVAISIDTRCRFGLRFILVIAVSLFGLLSDTVRSQEAQTPKWTYTPESLQPFWLGDTVVGESVLLIRDPETGEARASVLFPIERIVEIRSSDGAVTYQPGVDYTVTKGSREIVVPPDSRMVTMTAQDLRRPAKSQQYELTHRDGNGEILFGATLEYHQMQTAVSYVKADNAWPVKMAEFDAARLPRTLGRLQRGEPLNIVLLGDSISTGCNASGWGDGAPFQPPFQDLLRMHLERVYRTEVELTNLAVGGTTTAWGLTQVEKVVEQQPDLVILAFGMNDAAGVTPADYRQNIESLIARIREGVPESEFILVATMLGNRDWIRLNHAAFPQYRDQLAELCRSGIALADMTSVWEEFLKRKRDWDLTGNGVNHPNDFGHRVYAQVLGSLLVKSDSSTD